MRTRRLSAAVALAALVSVAGGAQGATAYQNGLVAYTRCCGPAGICTIRADGTGRRLVYRPAHDDAPLTPSWSTDGRSIAYAPGGAAGGIWVMDSAGRNRRRIALGMGDTVHPSWSPSGRTLVFSDLRSRGSRAYDLFTVGRSGRGLKRLTASAAVEGSPAWAPNGGEIVYDRGLDLWRMRTDGTGQRLLARNATAASWSPGGTRIAYIRFGDPWVMSRDGSGASAWRTCRPVSTTSPGRPTAAGS